MFISVLTYSQSKNDTIFDLLKSPNSPGETLLGFSPSEIDKPSDISALMLNLQTQSSNYSKFPSRYAIDFAPYWLLSKKSSYTTDKLDSNNFCNTFKQTLLISISSLSPDSSFQFYKKGNSYAGLGFKFTIIRGKYSNQANQTLKEIGDIQEKQISILGQIVDSISNSKKFKKLEEKRIKLAKKLADKNIDPSTDKNYNELSKEYDSLKTKLANEIVRNSDTIVSTQLKVKAVNLILKRIGWNWDIAGGVSSEFVDKRFDSSYLHNAGIWSNLSYTSPDANNTFLLLARYLYSPNKIILNKLDTVSQNLQSFDAGLRYVYSTNDNKFNVGLEGILRSYVNNVKPENTWKLVFNADYALYKNQKLAFSFGKDFDGTITKSGNLIAALTFIQGIGNKR